MRLIQSASYLMPWSTSLRALAHHSYLWTSQEPIAASTSTPVYKVSNKPESPAQKPGSGEPRAGYLPPSTYFEAGTVLFPCLVLIRSDCLRELAVFPRQNDVLNEQGQVDEQQQRRRVLKEAEGRYVYIDQGQPDRAVEEEVLVAHAGERYEQIGQKSEKGEPSTPGRIAGPVGFVQESLSFLGQFRDIAIRPGSGRLGEDIFS